MTRKKRLFFLDQHGCAKNQVDGELIIQHMSDMGWSPCDDASDASLIIVNSCGFIESAKVESINSLMDARNAYPNSKIILAGCLAERYAEDFAENLPEADAIFGNGDISRIKDLVQSLFPDEDKKAALTEPASAASLRRIVVRPAQEGISTGARCKFLNYPSSAYLKITEGCSNCCSFCAIPLIRGNLRSRSIADIISEFKELLAKGIFEINLIGQDLAAFGRDGVTPGDSGNQAYFQEPSPLSELLRSISAVPGKFWVRLLYIHPDHFPFDIIPILKSDKRLLPYFDIPFQSGSNSVLKAMNRSSSAEAYMNIVTKLRSELDAVIRTTFLCGFPGETEENAGETEEFLERVEVDWCGCFAYSREEDTLAYSLKKQVPAAKAEARTKRLLSKQESITERQLRKRVGKIYDVLIEEVIETQEEEGGLALGRAWFQAPDVDGACVVRYDLDDEKACDAVRVGKVVAVKVLAANGVDLDTLYLPQGRDS
ncbi:MAG: 30S ribosomal protein S12 methylthiotransferase RimO [Treponemataceae bacterium]|nr:30S ribosomal protein S12 methylthiotransferase RimO [Treponemataceae bacterium]